MMADMLEKVVEGQLKQNPPQFNVGDTKIVEGDRERVQVFNGTVIARKGRGINENFTVRRIVNNEGVERVFPLHSPSVVDIAVKRSGYTRRSKLYFLRDRVGKSTRLREKWIGKEKEVNSDE